MSCTCLATACLSIFSIIDLCIELRNLDCGTVGDKRCVIDLGGLNLNADEAKLILAQNPTSRCDLQCTDDATCILDLNCTNTGIWLHTSYDVEFCTKDGSHASIKFGLCKNKNKIGFFRICG